MKTNLISGITVGIIMSVYSWLLNTEVGQASVFPDIFSIILALGLMSAAMRLELRRMKNQEGPSLLKRGFIVSLTSGVVLGLAHMAMMYLKLDISAISLHLFGFFTATGSMVVLGLFSTWVVQLRFARGQGSMSV